MDVVDAFVVTLGLKDDDFVRHARIVLGLQDQMRKEAQRQHKEQQQAASATVDSFRQIRREVVGLAAEILGGVGLVQFARNTIALTANVGRLSTSLGISTEQISAWQGAIRAMGGTSEEASGDLMTIVKAFEDIQLTGNSPLIPVLRQLGFGLDDLKDPTKFLLTLGERLHALAAQSPAGGREAFNLGKRLGLSDDMVNLLIQGRIKTQEQLDRALKAYPIHKADADAAAAAQAQWQNLADAYARVGNTILTELAPSLIKLANGLENIALWLDKHPNVAMAAFAGSMYLAAAGAFRLAAGLLAAGGAAASGLPAIAAAAAALAGAAVMTGPAGVGVDAGLFNRVMKSPKTASDKDLSDAIDYATTITRSGDHPQFVAQLAQLRAEQARRIGAGFGAMAGPHGLVAPAAAGGAAGGGTLGSMVASIAASLGVNAETARGLGAAAAAEGATSANQRDQYDSRGRFAFGAFQFRGKEQAALFAKYGDNPTLAQQVAFVLQRTGAARWHADALGAMRKMVLQYLQPGAGTAGDLRRGAAALPSIQISQLTIYAGAGANGRQIGRDLHSELVAQANRGMS